MRILRPDNSNIKYTIFTKMIFLQVHLNDNKFDPYLSAASFIYHPEVNMK